MKMKRVLTEDSKLLNQFSKLLKLSCVVRFTLLLRVSLIGLWFLWGGNNLQIVEELTVETDNETKVDLFDLKVIGTKHNAELHVKKIYALVTYIKGLPLHMLKHIVISVTKMDIKLVYMPKFKDIYPNAKANDF